MKIILLLLLGCGTGCAWLRPPLPTYDPSSPDYYLGPMTFPCSEPKFDLGKFKGCSDDSFKISTGRHR